MNAGKIGLAIGGVALVGAVGIVTRGVPLQVDPSVPVGPFVIQAPTDLFSFDSDQPLVVAPEVINETGEGLITLPEVQTEPDVAVEAPEQVNYTQNTALGASGASALEAASAYESAAAPYAGCSGAH